MWRHKGLLACIILLLRGERHWKLRLNVADLLLPVSQSLFLVSTRRDHSVKRDNGSLGNNVCRQVRSSVCCPFCQVAEHEFISATMN